MSPKYEPSSEPLHISVMGKPREAEEWPAFTKWGGKVGVEHLKSLHGDTPVDVAVRSSSLLSVQVLEGP